MKHLFIINPAAGSRDRTKKYKEQIEAVCAGLDYRIEVSKAPGDCTRIAREAALTGEEYRLYACGGDGTLNEVAAGAAGHDNVAVTVFSGGSGNDFVKMFNENAGQIPLLFKVVSGPAASPGRLLEIQNPRPPESESHTEQYSQVILMYIRV